MFSIYCHKSMENISGSELILSLFPAFKSGRAAQILFLEFIKDGPADLGYEFTCGSLGKQKNIYVSSVARCLSVIASFNPTSKGFLKFYDFLLDVVV